MNNETHVIEYVFFSEKDINYEIFFRGTTGMSTATTINDYENDKILIFISEKNNLELREATIVHEYFEGRAFRDGMTGKVFMRLAYKYVDYVKKSYQNKYNKILDFYLNNSEKLNSVHDLEHYFALLKEIEYVLINYSEQKIKLHQKGLLKNDRLGLLSSD